MKGMLQKSLLRKSIFMIEVIIENLKSIIRLYKKCGETYIRKH